MQVVRIHAAEDVRIENIDSPMVQAGKVLLTGGYTGLCGSDLHLFFAPETFGWDFTRPAKLTGAQWPQILGHEFSGIVSAVGAGVDHLVVGDHVAVFPYHVCNACDNCRAGFSNLCPHIAFEGIQGLSGGMAEHKIADADACFLLPENVDLALGALVEPMAVAWHGVELAAPEHDGGAVVVGGGPIGVGAWSALRAQGVRTVVVSEPSAERRRVLSELGVEHIVDPTSEVLPDRVRQVLPNGAAVVIDCAGVPVAFSSAMDSLGLAGRMVIVAAYERPVELSLRLLRGDRSIRSSTAYTRSNFGAVIAAMADGHYRTDVAWFETVGFADVEQALRRLRTGDSMKVLVRTP